MTGHIESNVSVESLSESKRLAATLVEVAARRTALALGRSPEQGAGLATALFVLMIGITQSMQTPDIDVALLPPDVRPMFEGESPEAAFLRIGRWIVEGSR